MTTHVLHATTLGDISKALQALHQHLLQFQARRSFFYGSPLELFDHATKDAAFAWLKPLREAIVTLDERRAAKEPISESEAKALGNELRGLLEAETGTFRDQLNAAFQFDPETIWAVGKARKSLSALA